MTVHLGRRIVVWLRTGVTGIRLCVQKQLHCVLSTLSCVIVQRLPSSLIRSSKMCHHCWRCFLKLVAQTDLEWGYQKCTNRKISETHVKSCFFHTELPWLISIWGCVPKFIVIHYAVLRSYLGCLLFTAVKWGGAGLAMGEWGGWRRGNCSCMNGK